MMKNEVKQGCPICGEIHGQRGLVFDGKGVNGCDGYRSRLATFESKIPDPAVKKLGNLFAASPELLEALQKIACWLVAPDLSKETLREMQSVAKAAIAKAERGDK